MEPLRPDDAFFLYTESASVFQHVGGLAMLDPSGRPDGALRVDEIADRLAAHLGSLPRLHQRLVLPLGGWGRPGWVEDAHFRLDRHVRTLRVAPPGGRRELEHAVEGVMSRPLDRSRPLWELYLLEGLDGGQQALLLKLHHAIADGVGALTVAERLFGSDADHGTGHRAWHPRPSASPAEVLRDGLVQQLVSPWADLARGAMRAAANPERAWKRAGRTVTGIFELARAGSALPTSLNGPTHPERRIVLGELPRAPVKAARRRDGGTDNDVVLAAVAAALHRWFAKHDPDPPARVRTMVPVSTRRDRAAPGTWTATLDIDLPVGPMGARQRLRAVTAATRKAKRSSQAVGSQFVMSVVGTWAPPPLHALFARFAYRGKWFNLIVSNVPGTRRSLSLAGVPVTTAYPIIPLAAQVGLTIAAITWEDHLTFGLTADPAQIEDPEALADAMLGYLDELGAED